MRRYVVKNEKGEYWGFYGKARPGYTRPGWVTSQKDAVRFIENRACLSVCVGARAVRLRRRTWKREQEDVIAYLDVVIGRWSVVGTERAKGRVSMAETMKLAVLQGVHVTKPRKPKAKKATP